MDTKSFPLIALSGSIPRFLSLIENKSGKSYKIQMAKVKKSNCREENAKKAKGEKLLAL